MEDNDLFMVHSINTMVAVVLVMHDASASAAMVSTWLLWAILVSATEGL